MEAKNTVMSRFLLDASDGLASKAKIEEIRKLLKYQAEITAPIFLKEGRQEVVEFMWANQLPDNHQAEPYKGLVVISKETLETQLKKWGL